MTKVEVIQFEYEYCGACPHVSGKKLRCLLKRRVIPKLWREIPGWCPLPDKVVPK